MPRVICTGTRVAVAGGAIRREGRWRRLDGVGRVRKEGRTIAACTHLCAGGRTRTHAARAHTLLQSVKRKVFCVKDGLKMAKYNVWICRANAHLTDPLPNPPKLHPVQPLQRRRLHGSAAAKGGRLSDGGKVVAELAEAGRNRRQLRLVRRLRLQPVAAAAARDPRLWSGLSLSRSERKPVRVTRFESGRRSLAKSSPLIN